MFDSKLDVIRFLLELGPKFQAIWPHLQSAWPHIKAIIAIVQGTTEAPGTLALQEFTPEEGEAFRQLVDSLHSESDGVQRIISADGLIDFIQGLSGHAKTARDAGFLLLALVRALRTGSMEAFLNGLAGK